MDRLPLHLQKKIAGHLTIEDLRSCFLAHRSFHQMLHEMTHYDGWTLKSDQTSRLASLKRYMPSLDHIVINIYEATPISQKIASQLDRLASQLRVSLCVHSNVAMLEQLKKRQIPLKIAYLKTTQQQLDILKIYPVDALELVLHHGPFALSSHTRSLKRLTIRNYNEQLHGMFTQQDIENLPEQFELHVRGAISMMSAPLLERADALTGVSLKTFAHLSNRQLKKIVFDALESHLLLYHFEISYFLNETSPTCTLVLKGDALVRAEIAILARLFLDTSPTRKIVLEIPEHPYDRQRDLCANLIYLRLKSHEPHVYLKNSRYPYDVTYETLLEELKAINVISYRAWQIT